jgi:hypothetical protein
MLTYYIKCIFIILFSGTKNISQNNGIATCQTQSAVNSFAMRKNQSTMNSPAM